MITAEEAKNLYYESNQSVIDYLFHNIEPSIIHAANSGKRTVNIFLDAIEQFDDISNKITPTHTGAIKRLLELGYIAKLSTYGDQYVPRGLADDEGNGPIYQNYGFIIGW